MVASCPVWIPTLHPSAAPARSCPGSPNFCWSSTSWGIGILVGKIWAAFYLKPEWKIPGRDICWLEALAIELFFYMLEALNFCDTILLVHSDSQGAIGAFEKRHCPNWHINLILWWSFPIMSHAFISPIFQYIESKSNPADSISRGNLPPPSQSFFLLFDLPDEIAAVLICA